MASLVKAAMASLVEAAMASLVEAVVASLDEAAVAPLDEAALASLNETALDSGPRRVRQTPRKRSVIECNASRSEGNGIHCASRYARQAESPTAKAQAWFRLYLPENDAVRCASDPSWL